MQVNIIQSAYPIYFNGLKQPLITNFKCVDTFERSKQLSTDKCYKYLEKHVGVITTNDVKIKAQAVSKAAAVSLDDVYKTMGLLSQYSSYKSLSFIENVLKERNLCGISSLHLFKSEKFPICLTDVFAYIGHRNFNLGGGIKNAIIVDSKLLNAFKQLGEKEKSELLKYMKDGNVKMLYFENLEKGYNIFNQGKKFEDFTIDILKKAKIFQKHNNKSIEYNVRYILNGEDLKNINSDFGEIEIIRAENDCTPKRIADNLNPIMPLKNEFNSIVSKISGKNPQKQQEVLQFLMDYTEIVTPHKYAQYMKRLHEQLRKFLDRQGKSMDDVHFVIPAMQKSFLPANYVYAKVNNIDNSKNLFLNPNYNTIAGNIRKLPKNSVAVIVDDCVLSGLSMKDEIIPYEDLALSLTRDKDVVFAPIVALETGIKELMSTADYACRDDKVIYAKLMPVIKDDFTYLDFMYAGKNDDCMTTSIIFPYMGPDFNCCDLKNLYEKFLYSPKAQKDCSF